jgi:hypothetical protein
MKRALPATLPEHIEKLKGVRTIYSSSITSNREFTNVSRAPFDDTNDDKSTK